MIQYLVYLSCSKSSDAEFIQYLNPVGCGPSLKTWPKWASHFEHLTSILCMPKELSSYSSIDSSFEGIKKLGHPQPESYFELESNKCSPQQMHL